VLAACSCIAGIICASVEVIAVVGDVEIVMDTASCGVAGIVSASIVVIAIDRIILALASASIARVSAAQVVVIAVNVSANTCSGIGIALACLAVDGWADHRSWVSAFVARNRGVLATSGIGATISCAWIVVIAINSNVLASSTGNTSVRGASVAIITTYVCCGTTCCRNARVDSTLVVVIADNRSRSASIASLSWSATIVSTLVVVSALVGAHACGTTRAKTKASITAGSAWNINASGNDKRVQNSAQLTEIWGEEGCLNTWDRRGNCLNFTGNG